MQQAGATILLDSLAYGLFPNLEMGIVRQGKASLVKAEKYILASGSICTSRP